MELRALALGGFKPTWNSAQAVALEWVPTPNSGSHESRVSQWRAQRLLAVLVLMAFKWKGTVATMENVRQLIDQEIVVPGSVLVKLMNNDIKEVREIATECLAARGCWFGDAVPFLSLNISDDHSYYVEASWPLLVRREAA